MNPDAKISVLDVPLDLWHGDATDRPDGEKPSPRLPAGGLLHAGPVLAAAASPTLVVPFTRTIREGSVGRDVVGAKRAVWRALGLKVPASATQTFGPVAVKMLKLFQQLHGLEQDGQLGPATLAKLGRYFDDYAFLLYEGYRPGTSPTVAKQQKFVAYCLWGYRSRERIHYAQYRPMDRLGDLEYLDVWDDCSEFFTKACKWAGMPDPNGMAYDGAGWTGTIGHQGRRVTAAQLRVGDAVLYGGWPDFTHVACYVGGGRVVSHGSEAGPLLLAYDYRPVAEIRTFLPGLAATRLDRDLLLAAAA